jgi:hypothetical protein
VKHANTFLLPLIVFVAILTSSCGGGSTQTPNTSTPPPSTPPANPSLGSLQLGNFETCPTNLLFANGMTCYQATVSNCPNALDLGVTFGYVAPAGTPNGTIVLLTGSGGLVAGDDNYGQYTSDYLNAGYAVVEVAWDSPWEDTTNGTTGGPAHSILAAACRPATLLNYIFTSSMFYAGGGRCAQGFSGGSGALGYTLSSYKGDTFLDKVVLQSGPVFSDIEQGCEVPPASNVTVCANGSGTVDPWCQLGTQAPWSLSPAYSEKTAGAVQAFTGDSSCSGTATTSANSNNAWKAQSIVNGSNNTNFDFPNTPITAWLCATEAAGSGGANNSTSQGQIFYEQVGPTSTPLKVYAVQNCLGAEGVDSGTIPALADVTGHDQMVADMTAACHKTH